MISEFKESAPSSSTNGSTPRNFEMASRAPSTSPELRLVTDAGDLGPAVRARRKAQSLRIDDAASLSGVSVDLLSRLENGKGSVRLDKLLAVLDSLGLALLLGPKDHPTMQFVSRAGVEQPELP